MTRIAPNGNLYTIKEPELEIFDGKTLAGIATIPLPDAGKDIWPQEWESMFVTAKGDILLSVRGNSKIVILDSQTYQVKDQIKGIDCLVHQTRQINQHQVLLELWGKEIPSGLYLFDLKDGMLKYSLFSSSRYESFVLLPNNKFMMIRKEYDREKNDYIYFMERWGMNENHQYICEQSKCISISKSFDPHITLLSDNSIILRYQLRAERGDHLQIWDTDKMECIKEFAMLKEFSGGFIHIRPGLALGYQFDGDDEIVFVNAAPLELQHAKLNTCGYNRHNIYRLADDSVLIDDFHKAVKGCIIDKLSLEHRVEKSSVTSPNP
ncbi:MAG: hypothetical protein ACYCQI_12640 [Gammaproteobacteria bacterium]